MNNISKINDLRKTEIPYFDFGKIPPQQINIEECILGAILLQPDSLLQVNDLLIPEVFYKDEHKLIYAVINGLFSKSKPIDILTVTSELRKDGKLDEVGGSHYLSELTNRVGSSANIEYHLRLLVESYLKREIIRFSSELSEQAYNDESDVFDLMDEFMTKFGQIINYVKGSETKTAAQIIKNIYQEISEPEKFKFIPSRFDWMNNKMGGWQPGNLYIIAARPGHGKTAYGLNEAMEISKQYPVLYFSLEMTSKQLIKRGLADYASITNFRVQRNNIFNDETEKFDKAAGKIEKQMLLINDKPRLSVDDIYLIAKKHKLQDDIRAIIIDHFHLIRLLNKKNADDSYSYNAQRLKEIAKELELPVICLFQLNRELEKDCKRKPRNTDLREVGEQDADFIMFLRRPELFGIEEFNDKPTAGLIILDITKQRDGNLGGKEMSFSGEFQRISEYEMKENEETPF